MCVQVTKTANRFEISSLLEKILLKQVRWCLTFVGLYHGCTIKDHWEMDLHVKLNQGLLSILYKPERNIGFHWITSYILYKPIPGVQYYFDVPHRVTGILI